MRICTLLLAASLSVAPSAVAAEAQTVDGPAGKGSFSRAHPNSVSLAGAVAREAARLASLPRDAVLCSAWPSQPLMIERGTRTEPPMTGQALFVLPHRLVAPN
jgi:hypothetical protein